MISRTRLRVTRLLELGLVSAALGVPTLVSFSPSAESIEAYEFVEITAHVEGPDAPNPFTDATFRDEKWAHATGTLIEGWDPYRHLATSHPVHREDQDRASA